MQTFKKILGFLFLLLSAGIVSWYPLIYLLKG